MRVSTCAAGAILIEEVGFRRYPQPRPRVARLLELLGIFWYYPLTAAWRTWATLLVATGRRPGWGRSRAAWPSDARPTPRPLLCRVERVRTLTGVSSLAVVVPGNAHRRTRERLVRDAERVTAATGATVVVFSGLGEAEHMRALWRGPAVELVVEDAATSTVENAVRTLPLLVEREIRSAIVVCAPAHYLRARWIFRRIYGAHGIAVEFRVGRVAPTPGAIAWELVAATVARRQVREARNR